MVGGRPRNLYSTKGCALQLYQLGSSRKKKEKERKERKKREKREKKKVKRKDKWSGAGREIYIPQRGARFNFTNWDREINGFCIHEPVSYTYTYR